MHRSRSLVPLSPSRRAAQIVSSHTAHDVPRIEDYPYPYFDVGYVRHPYGLLTGRVGGVARVTGGFFDDTSEKTRHTRGPRRAPRDATREIFAVTCGGPRRNAIPLHTESTSSRIQS